MEIGDPEALRAARRLSVAPMMDWTDRHCRLFHRQFSRAALLYTEMVTASGLVLGGADWLLEHAAEEHPLALQLGGSEPEMLARAVEMALPLGFAEINLNVGCPSDRVQSGRFGACLMREPALVARCCAAMIAAAGQGGPEITVKCRIGVDEQAPEAALPALIDACTGAGVRVFVVHARKAWLDGLSPKENRTVPPLDHGLVARLKRARPGLTIIGNGGIASLAEAAEHLGRVDGVMIGRAAYHDPAAILGGADALIAGRAVAAVAPVAPEDAVRGMYGHIEAERSRGTPLNRITRHMLGAFAGRPGARRWRQALSGALPAGAGPEFVDAALAHLAPVPAQAAE